MVRKWSADGTKHALTHVLMYVHTRMCRWMDRVKTECVGDPLNLWQWHKSIN